jgi:hypothetical protein
MARKKKSTWSNYGDGLQVVDITSEVRELDRFRLTEGKDSPSYKKQHEKTVRLIRQFNSELGGRGEFGLSISKARSIIQYSDFEEKKATKEENLNG